MRRHCPAPSSAPHVVHGPRRRLLLLALLATGGCATAPPPRTGSTLPALDSEQARDLAVHALGLVGTPYRWGGNTPEGGFDCSGLIGYVYRARMGRAPPRTVAQLSRFGASVDLDERRTGDLVLFGRGTPTHAGIYVGGGRFVHAPSAGGDVRVDSVDGGYWSRQSASYRRP